MRTQKRCLGIALNVPVRYYDEWIPESLRNKVRDFERIVKGLFLSGILRWNGVGRNRPS